MSTAACNLEYNTLNRFQKEIHEGGHTEDVTSIFFRESRKSTWYSMSRQLLASNHNGKILVATVNKEFHFLFYTVVQQRFPSIRVREQVADQIQICWCNNLAFNHNPTTTLHIDNNDALTVTSTWCDIYKQLGTRPEFVPLINRSIGNVPFLTNWTTKLPEYTTYYTPPFYHVKDSSQAIPLFFFSKNSEITYRHHLQTDITSLLRMRIKHVDPETNVVTWKECKVLHKYLQIDGSIPQIQSQSQLQPPEIWGHYGYISSDEKEFYLKCQYDDLKSNADRIFYIDDVIRIRCSNPVEADKAVTIKLSSTNSTKAIYWVAENLTARKNHNFSNYTTNAENISEGWNPIKSVTLKYEGEDRFKDLGSAHFDTIEPLHHCPCSPQDPGYNMFTLCYDPSNIDPGVGIVGSQLKAEISFQMGDTNPFNRLNIIDNSDQINDLNINEFFEREIPTNNPETYDVQVFLLVQKKMIFTKNPDGTFQVTIEK